jgi:hypothetical protein
MGGAAFSRRVVEGDAEPASLDTRGREHDARLSTTPPFPTLGSSWVYSTVFCRAEFPAGREKSREFSPIQPFFANIRLENICEWSGLQTNSLRIGAGNFFARTGN